ncbi:hypothetical protein VPNG_05251 [Cytospora leucostoma]|uniref:Uncharacterized protein n=1 Tax=Cytospora leucostoma TaxID=1230097 RepID=A0A423X808_9PEZI|nr:hypothetical protein VPNG_05251 [Cytospora leucostoma]
MTPTKDKQRYKYRPATVVYPQMTPELTLAYRIFSPGLAHEEGLGKLEMQMHRITEDVYVDEEVTFEDGKQVRRGVGILEDLKKQMGVTEDQITEAYKAYKAEIERMMDEDRAYLAAKARGEVPEEDGDGGGDGDGRKRGTKRKASSSSPAGAAVKIARRKTSTSSSSVEAPDAQVKSPSQVGSNETADNKKNPATEKENKNETPSQQDNENNDGGEEVDEDSIETEFHEVPTDRWITKTQALAKLTDAQQVVSTMRTNLDLLREFYTTQMVPRHEITEVFQSADSYVTRMRAYVQDIYEVVEGHDGEVQGGERNVWGDDRTRVTELVLEAIPMVDEIPLRVAAMDEILDEAMELKEQLAQVQTEQARKRFRAKLALFVRQARTPVPPDYCLKDIPIIEDPGSDGSISALDPEDLSEELIEESPEHGRGDRADANNHEVITLDDD